MPTPYHACYFSHELTRQHPNEGVNRLSTALFDACVDLNPHQIEAALFALRSPLLKGVILADEVGLGKTIEAGLVLCQYWAERKRKLIVICPASLRKQWSLELAEKFNLPNLVLDATSYRRLHSQGNPQPFHTDRVIITSMNFASRMKDDLRQIAWDLAVIDEAHKLRNAYRPSNRMGQNIKQALTDRKKILLTATPLQNSLLELYGMSSIIDDNLFGDVSSFRWQYMHAGANLNELRDRMKHFCQRTLRRDVLEYIRYTNRRLLTHRFNPTDDEHQLYEAVSRYLAREETIALPRRQRHLTTMILRKLLASSSHAVANTLKTMRLRLEHLRTQPQSQEESLIEQLIEDEEMEEDLLDEILGEEDEPKPESPAPEFTLEQLEQEIDELKRYEQWSRSIGIDTKSRALLKSLEMGFQRLAEMDAQPKALVFTESRRTQEYLRNFLEANGYAGKVVLFNGTNADASSKQIIDQWLQTNKATGRLTGSRTVDARTALIEHFRDHATILIATEAAAEGVNLQFCSLVINYDLPWNPQRIEQRIGRCHRYGQKHDVVVINFLNERNAADQRVHQLLDEKFNLFNGVFGASDDVLGSIESGVDFERKVFSIYQTCRTPAAIDAAFAALQREMEEVIRSRVEDTQRQLFDHFDETVHERLKLKLSETEASLDKVGTMFWKLTKYMLKSAARFNDKTFSFTLEKPPGHRYPIGTYHLISKKEQNEPGEFLYRLSSPLGEWVLEEAKRQPVPPQLVIFDYGRYGKKLAPLDQLRGQSGWLTLHKLIMETDEYSEEYLLFSAFNNAGESLDQETCQKLFQLDGQVQPLLEVEEDAASKERLAQEAKRHAEATTARSLETNNSLFHEERTRVEQWADDLIASAEQELKETKEQIKALNRQSRLAPTLEEQKAILERIQLLEKQQRRQRQQIFDKEDEVTARRDLLISRLQQRMKQRTKTYPVFTIRWEVV